MRRIANERPSTVEEQQLPLLVWPDGADRMPASPIISLTDSGEGPSSEEILLSQESRVIKPYFQES